MHFLKVTINEQYIFYCLILAVVSIYSGMQKFVNPMQNLMNFNKKHVIFYLVLSWVRYFS